MFFGDPSDPLLVRNVLVSLDTALNVGRTLSTLDLEGGRGVIFRGEEGSNNVQQGKRGGGNYSNKI